MRDGRWLFAACLAGAAAVLPAEDAAAEATPEGQRVREFTRVLEEAAKVLDGRPIDSVERVSPVLYRVQAGPCSVHVRVVFRPGSEPGPEGSAVIPGKPRCP